MMKFSRSAAVAAAAVAIVAATSISDAANSATVDSQFSAAVAKILKGVHNDFLDGLSPAEMRAFVTCAQRIMASAPQARKQYVLAAPNQGEMRKRFDEVALDNKATLKQKIGSQCS